ncbi:hypothetical protein [Psychromonas ingrahamii]|uniref:hypothetical protein n=1 Tax=Psychromonas ingrahamii TaxID=357794 RepID=UPI0005A1E8E3|nr:hypothetical protein [Psychromonas ingrahamii]
MSFRDNSEWNELNELRSLAIFKKLELEGFPRNKQIEYCKNMALKTKLDAGNISAKVSNYKSVAGINKPSNASVATKETFKRHGKLSLAEIEERSSKMEVVV